MNEPTPPQPNRYDSVTLAVLVSEVRALKGTVEKVAEQSEEHRASMSRVETALAVGAERMTALTLKDKAIDDHLEATDSRVNAIESDKRSLAGFWTGLTGLAAAVGSFFYALFHKT